jgi:ATP-dependent DNA ligase
LSATPAQREQNGVAADFPCVMTRFILPLSTRPMEAKTGDAIPDEHGPWQYEPKWDGFRCLVFREGKAVELRAKSGKSLGRFFPEVAAMFRGAGPERFVLDSELIIEVDGRSAFDALQMRLHPAQSRIRRLAAETPATVMLFDALAVPCDARLFERPLSDRRAALQTVAKQIASDAVRLSPRTLDRDVAASWLADRSGETDGIVAKLLDAPYRFGERAMVKVKRLRSADCVVGGFRYLSGRPEVGSLLLGLYDDEGLLDHVGFTSTIANEERGELTARLEALEAKASFTGRSPGGPSRWSTERSGDWQPVRPELVVEVRYDHVTADRFRHGTKLLRWRPDKAPRQCTFDQICRT